MSRVCVECGVTYSRVGPGMHCGPECREKEAYVEGRVCCNEGCSNPLRDNRPRQDFFCCIACRTASRKAPPKEVGSKQARPRRLAGCSLESAERIMQLLRTDPMARILFEGLKHGKCVNKPGRLKVKNALSDASN